MAGIGKAIKGLGLLAKNYKKGVSEKASSQIGKRTRTKAEMIEKIRQLDPKVYGKDIATFGSGIEKKQIKKIFNK